MEIIFDELKNKDYLVLYPECYWQIKTGIYDSFENILSFNNSISKEQLDELISFINDNINLLIIVNFDDIYRKILPYIKKKVVIKCLYSFNYSFFTDWNIRNIYNGIIEFYDRNIINEIVFLDNNSYEISNASGIKSSYMVLNVKKVDKKQRGKKIVGILGNDYNPNHNVYNELSAIKLSKYDTVKIDAQMEATKHFLNYFGIEYVAPKDYDDLISNNEVNLYCNFTDMQITTVIRSMDLGIPCILGNTSMFDDYSTLKKYLVLDSDDDINEIAFKLDSTNDNYVSIMSEYTKFREEYDRKYKECVKHFLGDRL